MTNFVPRIRIRPVESRDEAAWVDLRTALWPDFPDEHPVDVRRYLAKPPDRTVTFVSEMDGRIMGFAEISLRDFAEDCSTSPVGYIEAVYVEPDFRIAGVGRALIDAGEQWARDRGCTEMASDRALTNDPSGHFHESIGYTETVRLVAYRKDL